jgi:hypothetical protein
LRQEYGATQPNEPRRLAAQLRHAVIGLLRFFDGRHTPIKEALTSIRQSQSPSGAPE